MSKKLLIAVAVLIVLGGVGTAYIFISSKQKETTSLPLPVSSPYTQPSEQNVSYKDSSGFSFDYPNGLTITDVTPDNYYSLLNVSKANQTIKITVKDGKASDISFAGADLIGATSLGGISAKQYKNGNNLITAAYDSGIVYLIEGPKDGGYFENAQNTIVSSFLLTENTREGSDSGITEEEVVQ